MIKRFFKFVAKSTLHALISTFISVVILLIVFAAIVGSFASKQTGFPSEAILRLDLTMNLNDTPPELNFNELIQEMVNDNPIPTYNLRDLINTLNRAKTDRRIKGIYLTGSFRPSNYGCSYPILQELRTALEDFKNSNKPIIAYSVSPSLRDLYVMSIADEFYLNKSGMIQLPGLYSEQMYFANAMEKYGIGVQAVRVGNYKSAVEPYTRSSMSSEAREASKQLMDELWIQILGNVAGSRNIDPIEINQFIQRNPMIRAKKAVELKLCDKAVDHNEIIARLSEISKIDENSGTYQRIGLAEYIVEKDRFAKAPSGDGIAIVYAEGNIVGGYGDQNQAGADRIVMNIRDARANPDVKAIVLRVNSPGGGATASKIIQDELVAVKEQGIPLIVSMGGYAASGGYLISQSAEKIFSHPHTITGSIGIFGLLFNFGEVAGKLGVNFDDVKTNQNSDILSISKPKSPLQLKIIQDYLSDFYNEWLKTVADYRNLSIAEVESVASGRVWSGYQAKKVGLVDEIGNIFDAMAYAAETASLEDYAVYEYPRKQTEEEAIAQLFGLNPTVSVPNSPLVSNLKNWVDEMILTLNQFNDPIGAYTLSPITY